MTCTGADPAWLTLARLTLAWLERGSGLEFLLIRLQGKRVQDRAIVSVASAISFGPFRLDPTQRTLLRDGKSVRLGGRALDILIALATRTNETISQRDLIALVWPDTFVEEANLRVHISAIRRALGEGKSGDRYIATIPGRGYRLIAPVSAHEEPEAPAPASPAVAERPFDLPVPHTSILGRDDVISSIVSQLPARRFVTLVGPGGIGKTRVALTVAERLRTAYLDDVRFVDLAPITDADQVPGALASVLGLALRSKDATAPLIAFLRNKKLLLVLDSCEQVVEATAALTEQILRNTQGIHILATSREAMRAEGERVVRLTPLAFPPVSTGLTSVEALKFSAIELFVERATESLDTFELTDANAMAVADICRRLDGIALAIELAAGRVDTFGVRGLAALLDNRFRLLTRGRRTALPRHQTLSATLDWSYEFLSEHEQIVLRRLAVFAGGFTLEAAQDVTKSDEIAIVEIDDIVTNLVAKSLVIADVGGAVGLYRLFETTRAYCLSKLGEASEESVFARRHAEYFRGLFDRAQAEWKTHRNTELIIGRGEIDNARAALDWAFSETGDVTVGVNLAAVTGSAFLERSLFTECQNWTEKALERLDPADRESQTELELVTTLGVALPFTRGNSEETHAALMRGLALSKRLADYRYQVQLLEALHIFHLRTADYTTALELALEAEAAIAAADSSIFKYSADWMLATSHHYLGQHNEARSYAAAALSHTSPSRRSNVARFGLDPRLHAHCIAARTLWLEGRPDRAVAESRNSIEDAQAINNPVMLCSVLSWVSPIFTWTGDLSGADTHIGRLFTESRAYSLPPYQAMALGLKGELAVRRGQPAEGIELLNSSLEALRAVRQEILITVITSALADAYASAGRIREGLSTIDEALARINRNGEVTYLPEALRIKGILLLADSTSGTEAEDHFLQSLDSARRQSALSLELRAATRLAALWGQQGRNEKARELLGATLSQFAEGHGTADVRAAAKVMERLR